MIHETMHSYLSFLSVLDRRPHDRIFFEAVPAAPVPWLTFEEGSHGAEVAFVAEKVCLLLTFGPEINGIRQGLNGLSVASDE